MASLDFERFHEQWFEAGKGHLKVLRDVLKSPCSEQKLADTLKQCREFYNRYVERKMKAIEEDASYMIASCWSSPLEISFLWLAGWRPTMSVILVLSLMGMEIEDAFSKILDGVDVPTMAALSSKQLQSLHALQQVNREAEDDLCNRIADLQMSVGDQEITKVTIADPPPSESDDLSPLRRAMEPRLSYLRDIVLEAEELRSKTVDELLGILTTVQSLQFIVSVMELAIAVRKLGVSDDHRPESLLGSASDGNAGELMRGLRRGLDPSVSDADGRTPLHLAASKGHTDCVNLLINAGADLNKKDNLGMTPLLAALRGGYDDTADLLTERGAKPQLEAAGVELCKATASGDVKYVERLVKHGVDPNTPDYAQNTPLHIAAAIGSPEAVALLVNEGADVLAKDRHGHTPLDEAREAESEAAVKILEKAIERRQENEKSSSPRHVSSISLTCSCPSRGLCFVDIDYLKLDEQQQKTINEVMG